MPGLDGIGSFCFCSLLIKRNFICLNYENVVNGLLKYLSNGKQPSNWIPKTLIEKLIW